MGTGFKLARAFVFLVMKMPRFLVRPLTGRPLAIDGYTLGPQVQLILRLTAKSPALHTLSPAHARAAFRKAALLLAKPRARGVVAEDTAIPGPQADIPVRIYTPPAADRTTPGPLPGVLFFHQGGGVVGDIETADRFCAFLCKASTAKVISVNYRKAPEHKFPALLEDGYAAYGWLLDHAGDLAIDRERIAVCGDSAGGYLTAAVCQEAKRTGLAQPKAQVMIYPSTDLTAEGGSMLSCAEGLVLTATTKDWFVDQLLNDPSEKHDERVSPLKYADPAGLAPLHLVTAGFDILRDQGAAYADHLKAHGVEVSYHCYEAETHGFTALLDCIPSARHACAEIAIRLSRMLAA